MVYYILFVHINRSILQEIKILRENNQMLTTKSLAKHPKTLALSKCKTPHSREPVPAYKPHAISGNWRGEYC